MQILVILFTLVSLVYSLHVIRSLTRQLKASAERESTQFVMSRIHHIHYTLEVAVRNEMIKRYSIGMRCVQPDEVDDVARMISTKVIRACVPEHDCEPQNVIPFRLRYSEGRLFYRNELNEDIVLLNVFTEARHAVHSFIAYKS